MNGVRLVEYGFFLALATILPPIFVQSFLEPVINNEILLSLAIPVVSFVVSWIIKKVLKEEYEDKSYDWASLLIALGSFVLLMILLQDLIDNPFITIPLSIVGVLISYIGPKKIIELIIKVLNRG